MHEKACWIAFVASFVAGCGGSSGAGAPAPAPPGIEPVQVQLSGENAYPAVAAALSGADLLYQLGSIATDIAIDAQDIGLQTAELRCESGSSSYAHTDVDADGLVGLGDLIDIVFVNCLRWPVANAVTGQMQLRIGNMIIHPDYSIRGSVDISMQDGLTLANDSDTELRISGNLRTAYIADRDVEVFEAMAGNADAVIVRTVAAGVETVALLEDFAVKRTLDENEAYSTNLRLTADSDRAGGRFTCTSVTDLQGTIPALPIAGSLECRGAGNSAATITGDDAHQVELTVDPNGAGQDIVVALPPTSNGDWSTFLSHALFATRVDLPQVQRNRDRPLVESPHLQIYLSDAVYSAVNDRLYVASDEALYEIDPNTATIQRSTALPDWPDTLAISDDGTTIYVVFHFANQIVRYRVDTLMVESTISLGPPLPKPIERSRYRTPNWDIEVAPGTTNTIAVVTHELRTSPEGTYVFRDGLKLPDYIERPKDPFTPWAITFRDANTLVALDQYDFATFTLGESGLNLDQHFQGTGGRQVSFGNGMFYLDHAIPVDLDDQIVIGSIESDPEICCSGGFGQLDLDRHRIFMAGGSTGDAPVVEVFDSDTLQMLGAYELVVENPPTIDGLFGALNSKVAFGTTGGMLVLVYDRVIQFIDKNVLRVTTPYDLRCASENLGPAGKYKTLIRVDCPFNDAVYDPDRDLIYASIPGWNGITGNSIAIIQPQSGIVDSYIYVGSYPGRMSLSADGSTLYIALGRSTQVAVVNLDTRQLVTNIPMRDSFLSRPYPVALAASPRSGSELLVNMSGSLKLYRDGLPTAGRWSAGESPFFFNGDGTAIYIQQNNQLDVLDIDDNDNFLVTRFRDLLSGQAQRYHDDTLYTSYGQRIDVPSATDIGGCPLFDPSATSYPPTARLEISPTERLVYYHVLDSEPYFVVCDESTLSISDRVSAPVVDPPLPWPQKLLRAGVDRMALIHINGILIIDPGDLRSQ